MTTAYTAKLFKIDMQQRELKMSNYRGQFYIVELQPL